MGTDPIRQALADAAETQATQRPPRRRPPAACTYEGCPGEFHWAVTPEGKRMPVDAGSAGDPNGNLAVWESGGQLRCRVLPAGGEPGPHEFRGVTHWATCVKAEQFRAPAGWARSPRRLRWEYRAVARGDVLFWISDFAVGDPAHDHAEGFVIPGTGERIPPLPAEAHDAA
jgi:hypothetical protein